MSNKNRPILIIDGLNVFIRYFLVNGTVNNRSEPIGGVVGFIKFIDYISSTFTPQQIFVVWETGGGNKKRKSIFKEYKSNRGKVKKQDNFTIKDQLATDENCKAQQLSTLYKLLKKTPICQIFVSGTECDDIIAYLITQQFKMNNSDKIIISCDKDFYQLLEFNNVYIYDPAKRSIIKNKDVYEKYNIAPRNFCLARSIVGDASDNINGVPGVGLKTVAKRFPDLLADQNKDIMINDIISECKNQIKNGAKQKVYNDIILSEDIIRRNWKLMYLDSSILSATDIAKIQYTIENHSSVMDKLGLIKEIIASDISIQLDLDQFSNKLRNTMTFTD